MVSLPDWDNYNKQKLNVEKTTERKCLVCGNNAQMTKFQRYCNAQCRNIATRSDTTTTSIKFR